MTRRSRRTAHLAAASASLAVFLMFPSLASAQRPYAPKAQVPDTAVTDALLGMEIRSVKTAVVPLRSEVEAPPYPGAVIIRTIPSVERTQAEKTFKTLPVIVLVTRDSMDRVIAFYRQRLSHWMHAEMLSTYHFWLGGEDFHPFSRTGLTTPSLEVREARMSRLVPDATTEIRVRYKPGGGIQRRWPGP